VFVASSVQKLDEFAYGKLLIWTNKRRKSRTLTDRLVRYVKPIRWENPDAQDARNDLLDSDFCNACARAAVRHLAPGYVPPDEAYYRVRLEAESAIEQPGFTMGIIGSHVNITLGCANDIKGGTAV
jgi:hypothetical protein